MILNNVSGRTNAVVIACTSANTDVFGHGDLNVVDVVRVPKRFKKLVCKPQGKDVLNGFLA